MKLADGYRILAVAALLLVLTGCTLGSGMHGPPADVPADFPVYPGATVQGESYGRPPTPGGVKDHHYRADVIWGSDDSGGKLFAYYKDRLAQGDWVEQSISGDKQGGGVIVFSRKSTSDFGGAIRLSNGKIHLIIGEGCPCGLPT